MQRQILLGGCRGVRFHACPYNDMCWLRHVHATSISKPCSCFVRSSVLFAVAEPTCAFAPFLFLSHGSSGCRLEAAFDAGFVLNFDVSLLAFDFSGCGQSEGQYISLGLRETDVSVHSPHHLYVAGVLLSIERALSPYACASLLAPFHFAGSLLLQTVLSSMSCQNSRLQRSLPFKVAHQHLFPH